VNKSQNKLILGWALFNDRHLVISFENLLSVVVPYPTKYNNNNNKNEN